jgi:hypothetical protein
MALDVYVGTLTRYYTHDWENVVQRQAREQRMKYTLISPDGPVDKLPRADPAEVSNAIARWQQALTQGLGSNLREPISWRETSDAPYFTDRPGYPGYAALVLWAAYADKRDVAVPSALPEDWYNDSVWKAACEKESGTPYRQVLQPEYWLPSEFAFCFKGPSPVNQPAWIGSSLALTRQLEALNAATFAASEADLDHYRTGEFDAPSQLEHAARFTLAVFLDLARKSVEHRLPMLLSC